MSSVLPYRTAVLTGTGGVIKLGVNNGAEPRVSPAAVGAPGGGGQTPFISGAGAGRVAKGTGLMGLHAFLHGGERGWCRSTNNLLADAPPATGNIEYSWGAAGHFSPCRPPSRSRPSRGYPRPGGPGGMRDSRPVARSRSVPRQPGRWWVQVGGECRPTCPSGLPGTRISCACRCDEL